MIELLRDPQVWIGFLTLTLLEIVLGIDNVVFISILAGKLPPEQRPLARRWGLGLALITRILFLLSLGFLMRFTQPLFNLFGHGVSGRDLILIIGGLFLVAKATFEIHHKLEGVDADGTAKVVPSLIGTIIQILIIDLVFSIDSVITAVGMVEQVEVMIAAVMVSITLMLIYAGKVGDFVEKHPTVKMLALAFLVLIGVNLLAEGFGQHIPKGYTYFAMAFSVMVEMLNLRLRRGKPVVLHGPHESRAGG